MDPASASDNDLNLQILRRLDREVEEVLATAGHVCLYYMHVSTQQWTRKNVEGSLFLLKRKKTPRFQMMVLNKLATENYLETIHANFDYEVNAPYLMYTHGNAEIHGIWFYDQEDLNRVFAILNRIKSGLPKTDILPPTTAAPEPDSAAPVADTAFWDKKVEVAADQQVPLKQGMQAPAAEAAQPAPSASSAHNLTSLLKQAHAKQQSQQSAAPAATQPPQPAAPQAANLSPPLLTPSFFQSQSSAAGAGTPPVPPPPKPKHDGTGQGAAAGEDAAARNPLQKLFAKAAAAPSSLQSAGSLPLPGPGLVPVAAVLANTAKKQAEASAQQPQQSPQPDALTKLFSSASVSRAAGSSPNLGANAPRPRPPQPPQANTHSGNGGNQAGQPGRAGGDSNAGGNQAVRERVRQAFTNLLANDAFVDMISEQFKASGLLR